VVEIRLAVTGDVSAVRAVVVAAYEGYVPRIGVVPAPMTADYDGAIRRECVWVAQDDGPIVGVLVLVPYPDHLLLENIAVTPAAQGQGIGNQLLAFTEGVARRQGLDEVRLYTNVAMVDNIAYYTRHGYEETHRDEHDGFRRVFMRKRLS